MKTYRTPAVEYARAALRRGPLIATTANALHYRFGRRRLFNALTVRQLIDAGEAVRDGKVVRAA